MLQRLGGVNVRWISASLIVGVIGLAVWTMFGGTPYQWDEQGNVEAIVAVVEHVMEAGVQRDVPAAQQLVARSSATLTPNALAALFQTQRDLFDGYQSITQERYGVGLSIGWRGTHATIGGNISYEGRTNVPFKAQLVKRNNQWRLITITFGEDVAHAQFK